MSPSSGSPEPCSPFDVNHRYSTEVTPSFPFSASPWASNTSSRSTFNLASSAISHPGSDLPSYNNFGPSTSAATFAPSSTIQGPRFGSFSSAPEFIPPYVQLQPRSQQSPSLHVPFNQFNAPWQQQQQPMTVRPNASTPSTMSSSFTNASHQTRSLVQSTQGQIDARRSNRSKNFDLRSIESHTNIYVRLLPPETRDSDLLAVGSRFGRVISVRAILSHPPPPYQTRRRPEPLPPGTVCKGVGFILLASLHEAMTCIAGLKWLGFEASLARDSVNLKLRQLADEDSTNLYLSNLPPSFREDDLVQLLHPARVLSVRLLRQNDSVPNWERTVPGASRGIGFARVADRETADQVIERLQGVFLPGTNAPLRVRYADTAGQKELKEKVGVAKGNRESRPSPSGDLAGTSAANVIISTAFTSPARSNITGTTSSPKSLDSTTLSPASSLHPSPSKLSGPRLSPIYERPTPPHFTEAPASVMAPEDGSQDHNQEDDRCPSPSPSPRHGIIALSKEALLAISSTAPMSSNQTRSAPPSLKFSSHHSSTSSDAIDADYEMADLADDERSAAEGIDVTGASKRSSSLSASHRVRT